MTMDEITKAIHKAQTQRIGAVLTRSGLQKRTQTEDVVEETAGEKRQKAKNATRQAVQSTLQIPSVNATATEHSQAQDKHRDAASAHSDAAAASSKPEDIVMHMAAADYHRTMADEHSKGATASPAGK
jgi:phage repressor protein C with HTH and peptisase S24 domain